MRSIVQSVLLLMATTAFCQDPLAVAERPSGMPLGKVRKVYLRVDFYDGYWHDLALPDLDEVGKLDARKPDYDKKLGELLGDGPDRKPKSKYRKKLAKQLAGKCIEIVENSTEADASLELEYRDVKGDGSGSTICTSGAYSATCTSNGISTTTIYRSYGGSLSMSGPAFYTVFVLRVPAKSGRGKKIGNWSLPVHDAKPSRFSKGLALSLLDAVECGAPQ